MLSDLFKSESESESEIDIEQESINESIEKCKHLIPYVYGRFYKDTRTCVRPNYIPFPSPYKSSKEEWLFTYNLQLEEIYKILINVINTKYPKNKIKWDNNDIKYSFEKLIYHCSSKYIDKMV